MAISTSKDVIPFDDYEKDCVNNYIKTHPNFKYKKCVNCNRNLPDSTYFFVPNNRYSKNIHTTENTCRLCNKNNKTNYRLSKDLTIKNKELIVELVQEKDRQTKEPTGQTVVNVFGDYIYASLAEAKEIFAEESLTTLTVINEPDASDATTVSTSSEVHTDTEDDIF